MDLAIKKLEIQENGTELLVPAGGRCTPQDCDWGVQKTALSGDTATVTFDKILKSAHWHLRGVHLAPCRWSQSWLPATGRRRGRHDRLY